VLASIYVEGDPENGGGTYGAILDTELDSDWIIGKRFSEERLDRCVPIIFGDHPYVKEHMRYTGTQWGWDYTVSDNYAQ